MAIPANVQPMWHAYLASVPCVDESRFYEAFSFGDSSAMADELGQLVLSGVKRATAGSIWSYEKAGKEIPKTGDLSVVTDSRGKPLCVIETIRVDIVPFDQVTAEFAAIEGEGDASLTYWRDAHRAYFSRECASFQQVFSESLVLACEQFRVVFPIPVQNAG
ncbi:ASCH domain-containing protein [Acidithiobacillus thiooxidans]|uniref:ASCH domain-containing protein n=1 Tax=Acidithiobacillus thiooxidans TaxID=930 RepID=UPI0035B6060C